MSNKSVCYNRGHCFKNHRHWPQNVGRIPLKIASGFSGFMANQWQNQTTIFSAIALKEVLPPL